MIPVNNDDLTSNFTFKEETSNTYKLKTGEQVIIGYVDKLDALIQAVYLILNTERYEYAIYNWDYGIELKDLYGQPMTYVMSELKRRITEALIQDTRIKNVDNFTFNTSKRKINVGFTVNTIYGDINSERAVII